MISLESLYKLGIRESDQLKTVLELYDMEIHQKTSVPNFQKPRLRNFDARHGKMGSGALIKSGKGLSGVGGGKGICYQWKEEGPCSHAVSATIPKIVRKNQNTLPPHLPSQPFHEVEVCRRKEVSKATVTMGPFFDNCGDII